MRWLVLPAVLFLAVASCRSASHPSGESQPATAAPQPASPATPAAAPSAPVAAAPTPAAPTLAVGDPAPDFALPGSDGHVHRLADDRGKRVVVLAWFPKAFTGG